MRIHFIAAALALGVSAGPAFADPWVPVDANTTKIIFLDKASVLPKGDEIEATMLWVAIADPGTPPINVLEHATFRCGASSSLVMWTAMVDDDGQVAPQEAAASTDYDVQTPDSMGGSMVTTVCTGVSPNATTAGVIDATLLDAIKNGEDFLGAQTDTPSPTP